MNAKRFKRDRPTIGILAGWSTLEGATPDHYRMLVMQGIQTAAHSWGLNVMFSWGIRRIIDVHGIYPSWPTVSPESDFIPIGPWNTDGLIVFTPIGGEQRSEYLQKLRAEGYPVLFIGTGEEGPQVASDNTSGIRQAVAHLAEHGHRRVAFIAGLPTDQGDSQVRLSAYLAAIQEYGLEADPQLVTWGWHDYTESYKAVQTLFENGVKFTAVLASNDNSAVGAMRAIYAANLSIPDDIAVMGFDDQPDALAQVPPLSSVHVPLMLMGEQALIMMADHLTRQAPLETLRISTRIIERQSCGCIPAMVSSALNGTRQIRFPSTQVSTEERQRVLVREMMNALPPSLRYPGDEEISRYCTTLVAAFLNSLTKETPLPFQTAFIKCINDLEKSNKSIEPWQEIVSVLRREMAILPVNWDAPATRQLAEDMLHQARAALGESAQRQDERNQYWRVVRALTLNMLTAKISAALSENQVAEVLETYLATIGIRKARVIFFQPQGDDPVAQSVLLNPQESPEERKSFPSRDFPPLDMYASEELLDLVLLPLVFQGEVLGYVAFDNADDMAACAVITEQLAATIKVARLHEQVVELSLTDALTSLYNRRYFEIFLKNEISRSQRFSRGLSLILVDCDNFKEYNDTYGHPAGDEALQQLAKCLALGRQNADMVARIGGDEFVIVLPETELSGALEVSRKIRKAVNQLTQLKCPITVSVGMAAFCKDMTVDALIQQADMALYESKRKGKNRISFFQNKKAFDEKDFPVLQ